MKNLRDVLEWAEGSVGDKEMEVTCHSKSLYLNGRAGGFCLEEGMALKRGIFRCPGVDELVDCL